MGYVYVPFCSGVALVPAEGRSTELVLRNRLCEGPTEGPAHDQTSINFRLARDARLEDDERARDS